MEAVVDRELVSVMPDRSFQSMLSVMRDSIVLIQKMQICQECLHGHQSQHEGFRCKWQGKCLYLLCSKCIFAPDSMTMYQLGSLECFLTQFV